ncbi:MAG: winged helix-turn-helix domain-containing protein [Proteobacteria bacterium]|nr:winged helix-turn-helix domain-containing protein [Pseudomonadota bacterium]
MKNRLELKVRILHGDDIAIGPGKIDLLEAILESGSISAAARSMGMSYRRAWLLVDTMNRCFRQPLVESAVGGSKGGGAQVTETGQAVLKAYRTMQRKSETVIQADFKKIQALLSSSK